MIGGLVQLLIAVLAFIPVIGLVVTIHELGHFLVAKSLGTAIDRFSIGFGKAIVSWHDRSGVEWRIGWLPFGGYVRFTGDDNAASIPDEAELQAMRRDIGEREGPKALERHFHFKPTWQRALIVVAGPVANFLLAIVLFAAMLMAFGQYQRPARIAQLTPNGAAAAAGFRPGDLILTAQGRAIDSFEDLSQMVRLRAGVPMTFLVQRGAENVRIVATPRSQVMVDELAGAQQVGMLGIEASSNPADVVHLTYGPLQALSGGVERTWRTLTTTVYFIGRMVAGHVSTDSLSGPLGMGAAAGKIAVMGAQSGPDLGGKVMGVAVNLLQMSALISVSLGFMNLLPLPVLDGGHLLFYVYEAVARRPLAAKVQAAGYRVGLALVLGLMLFATWNDLQRQHVLHFLGGLFS